MSAVNVESHSLLGPSFLIIRESTVEKDLLSAVPVGNFYAEMNN